MLTSLSLYIYMRARLSMFLFGSFGIKEMTRASDQRRRFNRGSFKQFRTFGSKTDGGRKLRRIGTTKRRLFAAPNYAANNMHVTPTSLLRRTFAAKTSPQMTRAKNVFAAKCNALSDDVSRASIVTRERFLRRQLVLLRRRI